MAKLLIHFKLDYQGAWPPLIYRIESNKQTNSIILPVAEEEDDKNRELLLLLKELLFNNL